MEGQVNNTSHVYTVIPGKHIPAALSVTACEDVQQSHTVPQGLD